jgi:hypothetical protein
MRSARFFSSVIFLTLLFPLVSSGDGPLGSWETIRDFVASKEAPVLEDVLPQLTTEINSNFVLPFETRSSIGVSLSHPGVIQFTDDASLALRFAGDPEARNADRLEITRVDANTGMQEGKLIQFIPGRRAIIDENPITCLGCHALDADPKTFRLLIDTYPDWVGWFGTSHNGYTHGRGGKGTSGIPTPEFEKIALEKFKEMAKNHPRYRHLHGLELETVAGMAQRNSNFGQSIADLNWRRLHARILTAKSKYDFSPNYGADLYEKVRAGIIKYHVDKRERMAAILREHGTAEDKKLIDLMSSISTHAAETKGMKAFDLNHVRQLSISAAILRDAGLPWEDLAPTLELGSFSINAGNPKVDINPLLAKLTVPSTSACVIGELSKK